MLIDKYCRTSLKNCKVNSNQNKSDIKVTQTYACQVNHHIGINLI